MTSDKQVGKKGNRIKEEEERKCKDDNERMREEKIKDERDKGKMEGRNGKGREKWKTHEQGGKKEVEIRKE